VIRINPDRLGRRRSSVRLTHLTPVSKGIIQMNGNALGLIETQGLVGLVYAVDAMLKAASVELASSIIKLDGGLVSIMIRGDVSSVRAAVEAGAEAAGRVGELKAAHVIPRPGDAVLRTYGGGA
jgi:ethanolamine utilization protein EutM